MPDFLVLTLAAPMAAFGELAGYDRRGTRLWPLRSAVLGLIGAVFGVRRDDSEEQAALRCWRVAVGLMAEGRPLRDYHTVQTVPRSVRRPTCRAEALARAGRQVNTVLTTRDYRSDVLHRVALWGGGDLPALGEALRHPHFVPYLGRKACPLAAPLDPMIVAAPDPVAALCDPALRLPPWAQGAHPSKPMLIASDPWPGLEPERVETRWDEPVDRAAWHFAPREVHLFVPEEERS